jgi:hypothetical protein
LDESAVAGNKASPPSSPLASRAGEANSKGEQEEKARKKAKDDDAAGLFDDSDESEVSELPVALDEQNAGESSTESD